MSIFHDVLFPARLAIGARGGPEYPVEVIQLSSGHEVRNASWQSSRRRWQVGTALSGMEEVEVLLAFFEARRGPLHGFRFRDPFDNSSGGLTPTDQYLGDGDGDRTLFPLCKTYGDVRRRIRKPVAGTLRVAVNGDELTQGWSLDAGRGLIRFESPPAPGTVVSAGFRFDCPVRFEQSRLELVADAIGAARVASVSLIELLGSSDE